MSEQQTTRRALLAAKARLLYAGCTRGDGTACAEGFALYHLRNGETDAVRDFAAFLEAEVVSLTADDPDGRLATTAALLDRVRALLLAGS
jgi:hypothetical protein